MSWGTAVTILVSVLVALAGYVATYLYNLRLAQRNDKLERIDRQLRDLYGPLLALTTASNSAWWAFRSRYRPAGSYWNDADPPTEEEARAWRLWMQEVFMPLNEQVADVVTRHADLLVETRMPKCLLDACAHVAGYRAVTAAWRQGDYSEHTSVTNFPSSELIDYASTRFERLKEDQETLLGSSAPASPPGRSSS
jgi:hypothetical protein